ncbi:MAG: hypothetical protein ABID09_02555 [Candidatus Omnitrophota bacterium]
MLKLKVLSTFLSRLSAREKTILYSAMVVISLTLLDRFIVNPIFLKIRTLSAEIEEEETEIKKNLRMLSYKDKIIAERDKYTVFIDKFSTEEEGLTSLLKEVEDMANKNSIYLIDMKPRGLSGSGESAKYTISLNGEAQMEQIVEFMYNIENSQKLLTIEKYEISPKARESSVAKCSMIISKLIMPK